MMDYEPHAIEALLRNYTLIDKAVMESGDEDLRITKVELDAAVRKLQGYSVNLYTTVIGVFVLGTPIQEHAKEYKISKRQVHRRLEDGLHLLVMIMNGEVL
jgi:DNA-directed RNA polymerase specialized sigma24 family protein